MKLIGVIWKVFESSFIWGMVAWCAQRNVTDQTEEGWMQTPGECQCAKQKQIKTVFEWCEDRRCVSLSACHLTISLSWVCYHTSFQRGRSGQPADMKIRTIAQLIGILWSYIGVYLGSTTEAKHFGCQSATSWMTSVHHIPYERGHQWLSYDV